MQACTWHGATAAARADADCCLICSKIILLYMPAATVGQVHQALRAVPAPMAAPSRALLLRNALMPAYSQRQQQYQRHSWHVFAADAVYGKGRAVPAASQLTATADVGSQPTPYCSCWHRVPVVVQMHQPRLVFWSMGLPGDAETHMRTYETCLAPSCDILHMYKVMLHLARRVCTGHVWPTAILQQRLRRSATLCIVVVNRSASRGLLVSWS
jgi:hypothetical protein